MSVTKFCCKCHDPIQCRALPFDENERCVVCTGSEYDGDPLDMVKQEAFAEGYARGFAEGRHAL